MQSTTKTRPADRALRAYREAMNYLVLDAEEPGLYDVVKTTGESYRVDLAAGSCTCPDHARRGTRCKHLHLAAFAAQQDAEASAPAPRPRITAEQRIRDWGE